MVEFLGHVAVGLLFAAPAWFLWDGRTSLAFVGFVLLTVWIPDVDLLLPWATHHGVTHTIPFVVVFAIVAGAAIASAVGPVLRRWWRRTEEERPSTQELYVFVGGGLLLGGLSHVLADIVAADWAQPVKPLWPFLDTPVSLDLVYYTATEVNGGLLLVALAIHAVLFHFDAGPTLYARPETN